MPKAKTLHLTIPPKTASRTIRDEVDGVDSQLNEDEGHPEILTKNHEIWVANLKPYEFAKDKVIHLIHDLDDEKLEVIEEEECIIGTKMEYHASGGSLLTAAVTMGVGIPGEERKNTAQSRAQSAKEAVDQYRVT